MLRLRRCTSPASSPVNFPLSAQRASYTSITRSFKVIFIQSKEMLSSTFSVALLPEAVLPVTRETAGHAPWATLQKTPLSRWVFNHLILQWLSQAYFHSINHIISYVTISFKCKWSPKGGIWVSIMIQLSPNSRQVEHNGRLGKPPILIKRTIAAYTVAHQLHNSWTAHKQL